MSDGKKRSLGWTLFHLGIIRESDVAKFLSQESRVPTINLEEYEINPDILSRVTHQDCERLVVIPVSQQGSSLIVAIEDPMNESVLTELKALTGMDVEPVIASAGDIKRALRKYLSRPS